MFVYTCFALLCGLFSAKAAAFDSTELHSINPVQHIYAIFTRESLVTNLISVNFDVKNPFLFPPLVIKYINSRASLNGTTYATFNHTFTPPFVINPFQIANSGEINYVNLTQVLSVRGALESLNIIPARILDIDSDIILDLGVISVPINGLKQTSVPTTYTLNITG